MKASSNLNLKTYVILQTFLYLTPNLDHIHNKQKHYLSDTNVNLVLPEHEHDGGSLLGLALRLELPVHGDQDDLVIDAGVEVFQDDVILVHLGNRLHVLRVAFGAVFDVEVLPGIVVHVRYPLDEGVDQAGHVGLDPLVRKGAGSDDLALLLFVQYVEVVDEVVGFRWLLLGVLVYFRTLFFDEVFFVRNVVAYFVFEGRHGGRLGAMGFQFDFQNFAAN